MASLVHVAVEKAQLEGVVKCPPGTLSLFVSLLEKLGPLAAHPGFMHQHSIDSVGKYIDDARFDEIRALLVSGEGLGVTYRVRKFDVISCEAADNLPSAQRRQCVAVRGLNEVARRLEPSERGISEIVVTFPGGGTISVRQNRHPQRMVVLCTSTRKVKKALDALLRVEDAPQLARLFAEAAGGVRQEASGPVTVSRLVKLDYGTYWSLPAWYANAVAVLAQDVFRLHAFVSATSASVSRALFVDRATAHRQESGTWDTHRTLIKATLHRASGGCACRLHRDSVPASKFQRLEFRMEFCGCRLTTDGKCALHCNAEHVAQSERFPGICMLGLKIELRCAHELSTSGGRGGLRLPLNVKAENMDLAFAKGFVTDVASCGARLAQPNPSYKDLQLDVDTALADLGDLRLKHAHVGDQIMQRDAIAVYLLRHSSALGKTGRFLGSTRADCNAILKTHRHLFRVKL